MKIYFLALNDKAILKCAILKLIYYFFKANKITQPPVYLNFTSIK